MQNLSAAHRQISASTIGQYRAMAIPYRDGTWNHDVSQNIEALLAAIAGVPPYRILDLGCGPGRDLVAFRDLGHEVVGLDGCPEFVAMARAASGCAVWQQDMLSMTLPPASFDGVFANAVLFHIPRLALAGVLDRLHAALKPGGVLLASNPRGQDEEGFIDGRYAASTTSRPGAGWSAAAALTWPTTTSVHPASPAASSRGSTRSGASQHRRISAALAEVRRVVRTWRDAGCRRRSPESQGFCGFRPDQVRRGGANFGCVAARTRRSPQSYGFRGFQRIACEP